MVRLSVAGMLFMGTIKTLLNKLMYGIHAKGIDGSVHSFEVWPRPEQLPLAAVCRDPGLLTQPRTWWAETVVHVLEYVHRHVWLPVAGAVFSAPGLRAGQECATGQHPAAAPG